ncbi:putative glycoside hydrolase family 3 protein [Zalerion maritima]|uniref:beta-glucosidase n=1 Tax=Zalerion maritima TaxID=339359 RepID=A0AAD5RLP4_9PEZI|nr:putative glycoside hydrolase family 3 protein [Zalerion maritima]
MASSAAAARRDGRDSDSDLDLTEYLATDPLNPNAEATPKRAPSGGEYASRESKFVLRDTSSRLRSLGIRSKTCCWAVVALAAALWAILASGGFFAYQKYTQAPPDGLSPPWYPSPKGGTARAWADSYAKAASMVETMTLAEKVNVTTGTGWMMGPAVGTTGPAEKVGFPQLVLQDGPLGLRFADNATAFPAGITTGATWNADLMFARGKAHAQEARAKGIHVLLGPCVGPLGRMPAGGRNWEGFGADPYLQGIAGGETVKGIQSQGVMATIKHFVANEQEHFRQGGEWGLANAMSSNVGDRAMHELYAWPFYDAVRAGVASVMCSYNMVNNSYACGNSKLLNGILKDEMGFQGFVMSDWLAQRSGVASALAGLDVSMPGDGLGWADGKSLWGPEMSRAVLNGSMPLDRLNDMATRVVASWYQLGQDSPDFPNDGPNFSSWTDEENGLMAPGSSTDQEVVQVNHFVNVQGDHKDVARQVAVEGVVMLKNDGILPLSKDSPLNIGLFGEDAGPGKGPNYCKDRGCNQGTLGSGWGSGAVEFPYLVSPVEGITAIAGEGVSVADYSNSTGSLSKQPRMLDQDVCMVFANADSGEGFLAWGSVGGDRNDLFLQKGGDDLIVQVAEQCKGDTVVVIHSVGPVVMERWIEHPRIKAVLYANLPGQESGHALADVVFGEVNPSGHLPYTIGKSLEDYGPGGQVLYLPNGIAPQQDFDEGIFIDYRYFQRAGIEPRFPFGFGLSYTTFELSNMVVSEKKARTPLPSARPNPAVEPPSYSTESPSTQDAAFPADIRRLDKYVYPYLDKEVLEDIDYIEAGYQYPDGYDVAQPLSGAGGDEGGNPDLWDTYVAVSVDVKNTGDRKGKAVPQLYLSYPETESHAHVKFPIKSLRGFEKVELKPGEKKEVAFQVTRRDLSYWDVESQNWRMVDEGKFGFTVGFDVEDDGVRGEW